MACASDREDAVSMALTVTARLLDKYGVQPHEVGFLQVRAAAPLPAQLQQPLPLQRLVHSVRHMRRGAQREALLPG